MGLGLIGGSIAQRWAELGGAVVGWSRSPETRALAADHPGIEVVAGQAGVLAGLDRSAIVVLATPLAALADSLAEACVALLDNDDPPTITDVGSVKTEISAEARRILADPSVFVAGHPMAGSEHAGWKQAHPRLFEGAPWALAVDEPVDTERWAVVARLALRMGARVVPVTAVQHDRAVAVTSHLPHLLAALLTRSLVDGPQVAASLAGPSFRSATRVVRGNGRMLGAELAIANASALAAVLDGFEADIGTLRRDLEDLTRGGEDAQHAAVAIRALFAAADPSTSVDRTLVESARPFEMQELRELAEMGGTIIGFEPDGRLRTQEPAA